MTAAPTRSSHPVLPWLAALAVMVMWASSFVVIRAAGADLSPGAMSLLRVGSAAIVLVPLVAAGRVRFPRTGRLRAAVIGWGAVWFAAYTLVLNASELFLDAATAAMLVNVAPLIVAVASGLLLGEGLSVRLISGVLVAFGGIALITAATSTGHVAAAGLVLGLLAAVLYAGSVLAQKPLLAHIDSTSMTVIGIGAGFLACLPFAPRLAGEVADAPASSLLAVVYTGVFPTALAFLLWGYALTRTPAGVLTSSSLLVPAISLVLAWLLLGETPPLLAAAGGLLCLTGAGFAILPNVLAAVRTAPLRSRSQPETVPERCDDPAVES
ncbi:DMT family transporter [Brachybacterium fresconis]|uniref:Drug/metabolite transporter (DMT)-like permease n=1 Tax=Brachybacterium fresconis TaxID=173363 RepID=A0ABS4YKH3_9MICO|nr:DMT family transporter [Brachybacterium fresconis]MBP2408418.1 drug/metabolite transporter (DMT)-like permease [Brachybacterium fresconis]